MKNRHTVPPDAVRLARGITGQTQAQAAQIVWIDRVTWNKYESATPGMPNMPTALYELYIIKNSLLDYPQLVAHLKPI